MNFLSAMLRDEGGLDYKAAIVDTIITVIEDNPEAKETGYFKLPLYFVVGHFVHLNLVFYFSIKFFLTF